MLFVVLPAYNEEKQIGRVIRGLFQHVHGFAPITDGETDSGNRSIQIIVVDDGSMDGTVEVAEGEGATVLRHVINRGQGAALQTGNEYALAQGAEVVVHFDADGQFNPEDVILALQTLEQKKLDVVLGSRFLDKRSKIPWLKQYILLPLGRLVNYFYTGLPLTDFHNGFRVLSRNALEKIRITQDGMAHNSEIQAQIQRYNLAYAEHPVEVRYHEFGQGMRGGLRIARDLFMENFR
ncbi:MAG TPA: glycosyltransferase family 2 protein [Patescibacteria group bacterium]|nr:glycosyltransferase family 2 protein [Patescibacteria group bacterium]